MNYTFEQLINMDLEDIQDVVLQKAEELAEQFKKRDEIKFREIGKVIFYQEQIKLQRNKQ